RARRRSGVRIPCTCRTWSPWARSRRRGSGSTPASRGPAAAARPDGPEALAPEEAPFMRRPSRKTLRLLALAAARRACAATWEAIARLVGRRPQTCWRWQDKYAADWERLYQEAVRRLEEVVLAEAIVVLARCKRSRAEPKAAAAGPDTALRGARPR